MTPHWGGAARGIITGISGSTHRGDVYRSLMEGIALEQAICTNQAEQATGARIDHYVAIGGGASDLLSQILAHATARPVPRSTTVEASSLGAAMAAAKGCGWFFSFEEASRAMAGETTRTFERDAKRVARHAELRAVYADLWPTLSAWNTRLADFVERGDG